MLEEAILIRKTEKKFNLNLHFSHKYLDFSARVFHDKIIIQHYKFFFNHNYALFEMLSYSAKPGFFLPKLYKEKL